MFTYLTPVSDELLKEVVFTNINESTNECPFNSVSHESTTI